MKSKSIMIMIILSMLVLSFFPIVNAAGPNYLGFATSPKDVTVGDSFTTYIYADISSSIDTAAADNMTFLPAGCINYSSVAQGDLFGGALVWITPSTIDNDNGYAFPIVWAYTTPVNNTNKTFATITWDAVYCGLVTTTITAGGTALGGLDPGTDKLPGTIQVHPQEPTNLDVTLGSPTQLDLTWTKNTGQDKTLIRWRPDTFPTSVTDGTELYNGTGVSTNHGGLSPGDHIYYSAWGWNDSGGDYSLLYDTAEGLTNSPPTFSNEDPTNGSIGQPLSFNWEIDIEDNEGDLFNLTIQCSSGSQIGLNVQTNGTKTLPLSGLSYATLYTIWVNATDETGSNTWTREWFTFTTLVNDPPAYGTPSPTNGSINQPVALTWSIPITDAEGNSFNWGIECSNGQSSSASSANNGTKSLSLSGLDYSTLYTVWVNATDPGPIGSGLWTREWFTFTTKANSPPGAPTPDPSDNETDVAAGNQRLGVTSTDPDGHSLTVDFYWCNDTLIDTVVGSSGSRITTPVTLAEYTNYSWYVNISDGYGGTVRGPSSGCWNFTTGEIRAPSGGAPPSGLNQLLITALFDGQPLDGATILIYSGVGTTALVRTANTTTEGIQSFSLPDGTYTIHVAYAGLQEQTKTITLTGDMAVIFNLQELGVADYMLLIIEILLLLVALVIARSVAINKLYFTAGMSTVLVLLLNIIAIVMGIYYFWFIAIAGAVLLIAEIIWMRK